MKSYQTIRTNQNISICRRCRKQIGIHKAIMLDSKFENDQRLYCLCKKCWLLTIDEIAEKLKGANYGRDN